MFNYSHCKGTIGYLAIGKRGDKHTIRRGTAVFFDYRHYLNSYEWIMEHPRLTAYVISWFIKNNPDIITLDAKLVNDIEYNKILSIMSCEFYDRVNCMLADVVYRIYKCYKRR